MSAGDDGKTERNPAIAGVAAVRGPLGFSRPQGAVLFSGELTQARQSGSSEPRRRRNIKSTLIYTHTLNRGSGAVRSPADTL